MVLWERRNIYFNVAGSCSSMDYDPCFGNKILKPARAALSKGWVCLCADRKYSCIGHTQGIAAPTNSFSWWENPSTEQLCPRQSVYSYFKLTT